LCVEHDGLEASKPYLNQQNPPKIENADFPNGVSTNFYRSDNVSATAYFISTGQSAIYPQFSRLSNEMKKCRRRFTNTRSKKLILCFVHEIKA
jgi:hypothetical protein